MIQMNTGMTSVTFRSKSADEIIEITKKAGLDGIEWGGDVHVPAGAAELAAEVGAKTRAAGLKVLSYGSYYRGGEGEDFDAVLQSAKALGAPRIRIWGGTKDFSSSSAEEITALAARLREAARKAAAEGIEVCFEYHRGTVTQDKEGALAMLKAVGSSNLFSYWQPNPDITQEEQLAEIDALNPVLRTIHVFYWTENNERHPLAEGENRWKAYLSRISKTGRAHDFVMEFVPDDSDEVFLEDARTLKAWVEAL